MDQVSQGLIANMKRRLVTYEWEEEDSIDEEGVPQHDWGDISDDSDFSDHYQENEDGLPSPAVCKEELMDMLLYLYHTNVLPAFQFCVMNWWISGFCQDCGFVKMGYKPGAPTEHYQRYLDRVLGLKEKRGTCTNFLSLGFVATTRLELYTT